MEEQRDDHIRVFIQDTPGFGTMEHEEIKMKTSLCIISSALLVYTMSCKELEDEKDAATLKELHDIDPSKLKVTNL